MKSQFFLLTPALDIDRTYEVISIFPSNYYPFKRWVDTHPWFSILSISRTDAYKLLEAQGGVGVGCATCDPEFASGEAPSASEAIIRLKALVRLARGMVMTPLDLIIKPSTEELIRANKVFLENHFRLIGGTC